MKFPATREELTAAGYVYDNDAVCRGCGESIEWWITPHDKKMPITVREVKKKEFFAPVEKFERVPHHMTCPNAAEFRRK